jgi:UDPglucose 6-dehydrogenase
MDPRIGPAFLNPGIGFGGFCFPKDVQAFVRIAEKAGCDFSLLKEVERINRRRIDLFVEKVRRELWVVRGQKIAVFGIAFKPNTDDIRFAPAIELLNVLTREGAIVSAYDPQAAEKAKTVCPDVQYCSTPYEAARGADAILIATEWEEFNRLDWQELKKLVARPLLLDGRNMFDPSEMTARGFHYISVGRPSAFNAEGELATAQAAVEALK